jgi:hypothetical protein
MLKYIIEYVKFLVYSCFVRFTYCRSIYKYNKFVKEARKKKQNMLPKAKWFNVESLKAHKKSGKLFVLGSGQSICKLSSQDWDEINKNDSMMLNFNVLLEHVPTYLMFEMPRDLDRKLIFIEWLNRRAFVYKENEIAIILRDVNSKNFCLGDLPEELEQLSYIEGQFPLSASTKKSLNKALSMLKKFMIKQPGCVPSYKASLFSACYIAMLLNYEEVYLVGFDLNNTKYFYEDPSFKGEPVPSTGQQGTLHKTAQRSLSSLSIGEALAVLDKNSLNSQGTKLYVTNPRSMLVDYIELKSITEPQKFKSKKPLLKGVPNN